MRTVLAHGHIFKNAGTTFDWSLRRNFGDHFLECRDELRMREEGPAYLALLMQSSSELSAISTHHLCQPLPATAGLQWLPVYLLRHPLQRVASVYFFERRQQAETPGAKAAKTMSFAEYVRWRLRPEVSHTIRNYQTYYLAGAHDESAQHLNGMDILRPALETLGSGAFVGLVERYDESMVLLEHRLRQHWPTLDLAYVHQNQAAGAGPSVTAVLAEMEQLQQSLIDANSLDLALYHLAQAALQKSWDLMPERDLRLAEFRQRCQALTQT